MKHEKVRPTEEVERWYTCDICGERTDGTWPYRPRCDWCKRDICRKHTRFRCPEGPIFARVFFPACPDCYQDLLPLWALKNAYEKLHRERKREAHHKCDARNPAKKGDEG